ALPFVVAAALLTGCGGAKQSVSTAATTTAAPSPTTTASPATTAASPAPLAPEAQAAATGDIPDNQVFLTFRNAAGGYSMKVPEGWAQQGSGAHVTIRDKNNIVRVVVSSGSKPGVPGAQQVRISGSPALKSVYRTQSAPNSVTGKRVTLTVNRYYLWHNGKRAVVDLGTPVGVDNVDAYRLMIESFRWH
ncbi:MAG: hypothetical protein QOF27_850, partial [Gaiellaceae bacterium]|nr:hypothetical protein [Gaiellaceae bacterium]